MTFERWMLLFTTVAAVLGPPVTLWVQGRRDVKIEGLRRESERREHQRPILVDLADAVDRLGGQIGRSGQSGRVQGIEVQDQLGEIFGLRRQVADEELRALTREFFTAVVRVMFPPLDADRPERQDMAAVAQTRSRIIGRVDQLLQAMA